MKRCGPLQRFSGRGCIASICATSITPNDTGWRTQVLLHCAIIVRCAAAAAADVW